jgi:hypothetical protein
VSRGEKMAPPERCFDQTPDNGRITAKPEVPQTGLMSGLDHPPAIAPLSLLLLSLHPTITCKP